MDFDPLVFSSAVSVSFICGWGMILLLQFSFVDVTLLGINELCSGCV